MNPDINRILMIYLGAGPEGGFQPIGCHERLKTAFPHDYESMLALVAPYLEMEHGPNAPGNDLALESTRFAEELARVFPELEPTTAHALASRWSYGWR